jgi:hypothetical protein
VSEKCPILVSHCLPFARKDGAKRLKASLIASMIVYYWCIRNAFDLSSIVGLQWSVREGIGFAAPRLFGAFAPSFLRSHCGDKGLLCEETMPYPRVALFGTQVISDSVTEEA